MQWVFILSAMVLMLHGSPSSAAPTSLQSAIEPEYSTFNTSYFLKDSGILVKHLLILGREIIVSSANVSEYDYLKKGFSDIEKTNFANVNETKKYLPFILQSALFSINKLGEPLIEELSNRSFDLDNYYKESSKYALDFMKGYMYFNSNLSKYADVDKVIKQLEQRSQNITNLVTVSDTEMKDLFYLVYGMFGILNDVEENPFSFSEADCKEHISHAKQLLKKWAILKKNLILPLLNDSKYDKIKERLSGVENRDWASLDELNQFWAKLNTDTSYILRNVN